MYADGVALAQDGQKRLVAVQHACEGRGGAAGAARAGGRGGSLRLSSAPRARRPRARVRRALRVAAGGAWRRRTWRARGVVRAHP